MAMRRTSATETSKSRKRQRVQSRADRHDEVDRILNDLEFSLRKARNECHNVCVRVCDFVKLKET